VGSSAQTYDNLALPVRRKVLFAGEHTCKEHPDTVGGAMLTGLREAMRALHLLAGDEERLGEAAAADVTTDVPRKKTRVRALAEPSPHWSTGIARGLYYFGLVLWPEVLPIRPFGARGGVALVLLRLSKAFHSGCGRS
jgi:hypothetical protein